MRQVRRQCWQHIVYRRDGISMSEFLASALVFASASVLMTDSIGIISIKYLGVTSVGSPRHSNDEGEVWVAKSPGVPRKMLQIDYFIEPALRMDPCGRSE